MVLAVETPYITVVCVMMKTLQEVLEAWKFLSLSITVRHSMRNLCVKHTKLGNGNQSVGEVGHVQIIPVVQRNEYLLSGLWGRLGS